MREIHVIAEAGTNHNGKLQEAISLIDAAAAAGANSVKFQLIYPEGLYLPELVEGGKYVENEVFNRRREQTLSDDDYRVLAEYARGRELPLSASIFDCRGLELLLELDAPYIKIASCDLNNSKLLMHAAETGRKMIVSTGMATLGEIEKAVKDVHSCGNEDLILMHCVSIYPAPIERMNLGFLSILAQAFGCAVGLSDHTESSLAAAIAVSKGASWIEKHITMDRSAAGFDHAYAMEPEAMSRYIADIRTCEKACQLQLTKISEQERGVKQRARRGLYAARDISVGEVIKEESVLIVRPEGPLRPKDIESVVGKRAKKSFQRYEAITWEGIE